MSESVKPYSQEEGKKEQISKMFNNIAPYYDFLNRFLSLGIDRRWRTKGINILVPLQPKSILDIATGTGDLAIESAKKTKAEKIIGIDIANEMLDIGRKKIKKLELQDTIQLETGDSENLRFEDNTFDAVTVAFGVRNFENLEKGLSEMRRVLRKGGKVMILEFSKPSSFPFKQAFNFYFKYILPTIGRFTSKDPKAYRYLYESVQAFPDGDKFIDILDKTGFNNTQWTSLTFGICAIYVGEK